ncbi:hypothetical protein ACOKW7_24350 [Limnospira platensis CENA597]
MKSVSFYTSKISQTGNDAIVSTEDRTTPSVVNFQRSCPVLAS